jgi:hypothetical protein
MNKVPIWLLIGGLFLLSSCSTVDKPTEVVITTTQLLPSPSPTELSSNIVSTPSLTSIVFNTLTPSPMVSQTFSTPEVTPTIPLTPYINMSKIDYPSGLAWIECEVSFDLYHKWSVADKCFGFPLSSWQEEDRAHLGERFQRNPFKWDDIRITINGNLYETDNQPEGLYILYRNEKIYAQSISGFTTFPPNRSLQDVGGKVAWELANPEHPTIIFDGQDLRQEHNLDAAYLPYSINDRLIFVAKKNSMYFVVYGEEQTGPEFNNISIGYCCGPAGYSIQRVQGQYWFWGVRENRYYLVMIRMDE